MSEYIDICLATIVDELLSYLRETKDVLKRLYDICCENNFRGVTMDVTSLYAIIDNSKGIKVIERFFSGKLSSYLHQVGMSVELTDFAQHYNVQICR